MGRVECDVRARLMEYHLEALEIDQAAERIDADEELRKQTREACSRTLANLMEHRLKHGC
jgi:hypothetical protein